MLALNETAPPKIFADANALEYLCFEIPDAFKKEGFKHRDDGRYKNYRARWVDALPLLGEAGVVTIIPAMVAMEIGDIHHSGFNINEKFEQGKLSRVCAKRAPFLCEAAKRQHKLWPNISIEPPAEDDQTRSAEYIRATDNAVALFNTGNDYDGLEIIKHINGQGKKDYGEEAAAELVRRSPLQKAPFIYLSNDPAFCSKAIVANGQQLCINLNFQAFIKTLHQAGWFEAIGVKPEITYEQIMGEIIRQINDTNKFLGKFTSIILDPNLIIDRAHGPAINRMQPGAFAALVAGLKKPLMEPEHLKTPPVAPTSTEIPLSTADEVKLAAVETARKARLAAKFTRRPSSSQPGRNS